MKHLLTVALWLAASLGLALAMPGQVVMWAAWWLIFAVNGEHDARRALRLQLAIELPPLEPGDAINEHFDSGRSA